ncbi:50S ribosomal protein L9 [Limnochorda sp.]|uniref:50S ribosomal protein L9 n=1 Tax=Limnochorda sp. TaxID=1940279 RepID=UPI001D48649B|nr:50S ribosomal protein L9 [Bacillota bacterium]MBO2519034.1 50S ribosomal protein L9 [Bacillota bacterium]
MKVILKETVQDLGEKGDIVDVKPGYARNYLFPRGLAMEATKGNLKQVEHLRRVRARERAREEAQMRELAQRIAGLELLITAKVGESGKLFGSVTAQDVADAIQAAIGQEIDRRKIQLDEPIKSVGRREVTVRFAPEIEATVTVVVQAEGGEEAPAEEPAASEPAAEAEAEAPGDGREAETEG